VLLPEGDGPTDPENYDDFTEVIEYISRLDFTGGARDLAGTVDALRSMPNIDPRRVAVWATTPAERWPGLPPACAATKTNLCPPAFWRICATVSMTGESMPEFKCTRGPAIHLLVRPVPCVTPRLTGPPGMTP
jgi:hypothetical protein